MRESKGILIACNTYRHRHISTTTHFRSGTSNNNQYISTQHLGLIRFIIAFSFSSRPASTPHTVMSAVVQSPLISHGLVFPASHRSTFRLPSRYNHPTHDGDQLTLVAGSNLSSLSPTHQAVSARIFTSHDSSSKPRPFNRMIPHSSSHSVSALSHSITKGHSRSCQASPDLSSSLPSKDHDPFLFFHRYLINPSTFRKFRSLKHPSFHVASALCIPFLPSRPSQSTAHRSIDNSSCFPCSVSCTSGSCIVYIRGPEFGGRGVKKVTRSCNTTGTCCFARVYYRGRDTMHVPFDVYQPNTADSEPQAGVLHSA
jgi:hypothetical protein